MGEKKKVVYILGARGPFDDTTEYAAADDMLTELGYETVSRVLLPAGLEAAKESRIAVAMIDAADAVVVLPNWQTSRDAVAERHLAYCLDKPLVVVKDKDHDRPFNGAYPPDIVKAWLKHDLEQALGEVSA